MTFLHCLWVNFLKNYSGLFSFLALPRLCAALSGDRLRQARSARRFASARVEINPRRALDAQDEVRAINPSRRLEAGFEVASDAPLSDGDRRQRGKVISVRGPK